MATTEAASHSVGLTTTGNSSRRETSSECSAREHNMPEQASITSDATTIIAGSHQQFYDVNRMRDTILRLQERVISQEEEIERLRRTVQRQESIIRAQNSRLSKAQSSPPPESIGTPPISEVIAQSSALARESRCGSELPFHQTPTSSAPIVVQGSELLQGAPPLHNGIQYIPLDTPTSSTPSQHIRTPGSSCSSKPLRSIPERQTHEQQQQQHQMYVEDETTQCTTNSSVGSSVGESPDAPQRLLRSVRGTSTTPEPQAYGQLREVTRRMQPIDASPGGDHSLIDENSSHDEYRQYIRGSSNCSHQEQEQDQSRMTHREYLMQQLPRLPVDETNLSPADDPRTNRHSASRRTSGRPSTPAIHQNHQHHHQQQQQYRQRPEQGFTWEQQQQYLREMRRQQQQQQQQSSYEQSQPVRRSVTPAVHPSRQQLHPYHESEPTRPPRQSRQNPPRQSSKSRIHIAELEVAPSIPVPDPSLTGEGSISCNDSVTSMTSSRSTRSSPFSVSATTISTTTNNTNMSTQEKLNAIYPTYRVENHPIADSNDTVGVYTGTLRRSSNKPHGHGTMKYIDRGDGRMYVGMWTEGRWHGCGKLTYGNGDVYEGEFRSNKRHGHGTLKKHTNTCYVGEFRDDQRHGEGKLTTPDGSTYRGEFVNGVQQGFGRADFAQGGFYEGEWKHNMYWGQGTCVWPGGRTYQGEFVENRSHGEGIEVNPDGSIRHQGRWEDNKPAR